MRTHLYLCLLLASVLLIVPGCYHAQVATDKAPSTQTIDQPFANSWIFGLVPPPVVETAEECPDGVARAETRLSFVNMLVGNLTFGIYTPMHIKVTCAAGASAHLMPRPDLEGGGITIPRHTTDASINRAFQLAAVKAMQTHEPVAVRFVE